MSLNRWSVVGAVSARDLVAERLVLHHASQLVAAVGRSLVPPRLDDGHTSLHWASGQLMGESVPGSRPWRAALRPPDLSLSVVAAGEEVSRLALSGRTRSEAFAWLSGLAEKLGAGPERLKLETPYTIPDHPVGTGAPFPSSGTPEATELARWFADGDAAVRTVAAGWPDAAPVRVWPHHFDIGSVLPLGPPRGAETPSIGVGLSLGDEGIAEPYFYVTLWPPIDPESLPAPPAGGRWNRAAWTGAVLTGSELAGTGDGAAQAAGANAFLKSAVDALRDVHVRRQ